MFSRSIKADPDTFRREKDANVEMVSKTMSAIEQKCVKDIRNVAFFLAVSEMRLVFVYEGYICAYSIAAARNCVFSPYLL